jgi:hypothetical protein
VVQAESLGSEFEHALNWNAIEMYFSDPAWTYRNPGAILKYKQVDCSLFIHKLCADSMIVDPPTQALRATAQSIYDQKYMFKSLPVFDRSHKIGDIFCICESSCVGDAVIHITHVGMIVFYHEKWFVIDAARRTNGLRLTPLENSWWYRLLPEDGQRRLTKGDVQCSE